MLATHRFGTLFWRGILVLGLTAGVLSNIFGQSAETLIRQSEQLNDQHKNGDAMEVLREADRLWPNHAAILHRMAKQYVLLMADQKSKAEKKVLGRKALEAAERAVTLQPNDAQARLSLAIVLGQMALLESPRRQIEMSRRIHEEAEAATRLDPEEDYAWHVLARWNYELANLNPLLKSFAEVIYGKFPDASNKNAANISAWPLPRGLHASSTTSNTGGRLLRWARLWKPGSRSSGGLPCHRGPKRMRKANCADSRRSRSFDPAFVLRKILLCRVS